jgi:hypothetical protein
MKSSIASSPRFGKIYEDWKSAMVAMPPLPIETPERILPVGMTPRLLSRDVAALYCGVSTNLFEDTVGKEVAPIWLGGRKLWDRRALDRYLDAQSGIMEPLRQIDDWLGGLGT